MFRSYFSMGWRTLLRNKLFTAIKILGLSTSLTICMIIFLFVRDEGSYDQFHEKADRIYRLVQTWQFGSDDPRVVGGTNAEVGESLAREIPEVEYFVRASADEATVKVADQVYGETPLFADKNFFSVFTFPLLQGRPESLLDDPHGLVISKDHAIKYFGTEEAVGNTLDLKLDEQFETFVVKGVISKPENSSLMTDIVVPFSYYESKREALPGWFGASLNTFLVISPGADLYTVQNKIQALFQAHVKDRLDRVKAEKGVALDIRVQLQQLSDVHFSATGGFDHGLKDGSDRVYSYVLSAIAAFMLLIACINFINLTIAQASRRSKEVGIRKIVGSTRSQLIRQFLSESLIVTCIAFGVAVVFTIALIPYVNEFAGKQLALAVLSDQYVYAAGALLIITTAVLAGSYPAFVLSALNPGRVMNAKKNILGRNYAGRSLVVFQFALSIFVVTGMIVVRSQTDFLSRADLGYDSHNLLRIDLPDDAASDHLSERFRNEFSADPGIVGVAATRPGRHLTSVKVDGKIIEIESNAVDEHYFSTLGVPIVTGSNLSPAASADRPLTVVVNETFVHEAGWHSGDAVGRTIHFMDDDRRTPVTVAGVIQDYHFASLREEIRPGMFSLDPSSGYGQLWVRIHPDNTLRALSSVERTFKKLVEHFPYTYEFVDVMNAREYAAEAKARQLVSIASALFIFISCIGLLGLVILATDQRIKEIGIRRVLGATVKGIVTLISADFLPLICMAIVVAIPAGYYAVITWLSGFAYRIVLQPWMFVLAGVVVIVPAALVLCVIVARAALADPSRNLRAE